MLAGESADEMRIQQPVSMFMQLQGAPVRAYPSNLLGVLATFKQVYRQAELAVGHETGYASNPAGMSRPSYDQETRSMYGVVEKEMPAMFLAEDRMDVYRILRLQEELGFNLMLAGLTEGSYVVEDLAKAGVPVFISLDLPDAPEEEEIDSTMSEAMQAEARGLTARRQEAYEMAISHAQRLQDAGVTFGFTTHDVSSKDIPENLRRLVNEGGLSAEDALTALTTRPADLLGLSSIMGTVEAGKVANLVITDGPYFDEDAKIRYVVVDGEVFEQEAPRKRSSGSTEEGEALNVAGTWEYMVETPQGRNGGDMIVTGAPGEYEATLTSDMSGECVEGEEFEVEGNNITFSYSVSAGGGTCEIEGSVEVDGDTFEGTLSIGQFGSFPIEGERVSTPE